MEYILDEKQLNYKYFEEICQIPRASFQEEKIADYLVNFAQEHQLWYYRDKLNNVIIKKEGTANRKQAEPIILQAHTDMVCVKEDNCQHDFTKDPIEVYVDNGYLYARGTSLGADDGAGVANILALLSDETYEHPPLECVFTVQEEDGIGGAKGLDYSYLTAKRMIGLDGLREGTTIICAPSVLGICIKKKVCWEAQKKENINYKIHIKGLKSGHGASNIGDERANAIKLVARILYHVKEQNTIQIVEWNGGKLANVIAAESVAVISILEKDVEKVVKQIENIFNNIKLEYHLTDPDIELTLEKVDSAKNCYVIPEELSSQIIELAYVMPHGLQARNPNILGEYWASYNFSILNIEKDKANLYNVCRACSPLHVEELLDVLKATVKKYGVDFEIFYEYAGHSVKSNSPMIELYERVYKKHTGKELVRKVNHGGLDIGSIYNGMNGLDVVVLMPNTYDVHTVNEHLDLESFKRSFIYLKEILEQA